MLAWRPMEKVSVPRILLQDDHAIGVTLCGMFCKFMMRWFIMMMLVMIDESKQACCLQGRFAILGAALMQSIWAWSANAANFLRQRKIHSQLIG